MGPRLNLGLGALILRGINNFGQPFLVMEYLGGGEVKWRNSEDQPVLTVVQTRRIMRDAVLGLEYRKWSRQSCNYFFSQGRSTLPRNHTSRHQARKLVVDRRSSHG